MLEVIDKYKFGIIAAFICYLSIFTYTNLTTYDHYTLIEPFTDTANIEKESKDEILEIIPEDIEIPKDFDMDVKNISQNARDDREASKTNYSQNMSPAQMQQQIKALEQQMKDEAGGSKERARLAGLIADRKKEQENASKNTDPAPTNGSGTAKKYKGSTMVSWDLNGRKAFNNTDSYVSNPGYTCDAANGVVVVNVKTNLNGDVIKAEYNAGASKNATSCMIRQAVEYAETSRFEYSTDTGRQSGYIKYTFILR